MIRYEKSYGDADKILDYFHSERSIEPVESNTFYQLICNALAVPIATEPWYVDRLKTAGWGCGHFLELIYAVNPRLSRYSIGLR